VLKAKRHEVIALPGKSLPALDIEKAQDLKKFLTKMEPIDHIVCSGGSVAFGPTFQEVTDEQMQVRINSKLMGQVNQVHFGHEKLTKGESILLTGGIIAYKPIFSSSCQVGLINLVLNGFMTGAGSDLKETGARINVIHPPLIKETAGGLEQQERDTLWLWRPQRPRTRTVSLRKLVLVKSTFSGGVMIKNNLV
jgi:NAD(P)-dependent dehydrogenase (short-subunit alcohol dehydrogenase family)